MNNRLTIATVSFLVVITFFALILYWTSSSSKEKEISDPATGRHLICKRADVLFQPHTTSRAIDAAVLSVQGKVVRKDKETNWYEISIPGHCSLQDTKNAMNILRKQPSVISVDYAYIH